MMIPRSYKLISEIKVASVFARSGLMLEPWRRAGCSTVSFDILESKHSGVHIKSDLRKLPPQEFDVVFCWPPCQHLAGSGARWWKAKGPEALKEAMEFVAIARSWSEKARWWMIENPVGRLSTEWRKPDWYFHPHQFAGYLKDSDPEAYTKKTCIWGNIPKPAERSVEPVHGSKMHLMAPSPERAYLRSVTPSGFAQAVFQTLFPLILQGHDNEERR